jgi:hypothetical protein
MLGLQNAGFRGWGRIEVSRVVVRGFLGLLVGSDLGKER